MYQFFCAVLLIAKVLQKCIEVESAYLTDITDCIQGSTSNYKNVPFTRIASTYDMWIWHT